MVLTPVARYVAENLIKNLKGKEITADDLRDACDIGSGGEYDTFQLDMLVSMVEKRISDEVKVTK
jgi:hypothetical protein